MKFGQIVAKYTENYNYQSFNKILNHCKEIAVNTLESLAATVDCCSQTVLSTDNKV